MKFNNLRRCLTITALVISPSVNAAHYYVATDGSDENSGTTLTQPFATIQHPVNQMNRGDTCFIRGGSYRESVNLAGKAGVQTQPITLTRYRNEKVILDGTDKIKGQRDLRYDSQNKPLTGVHANLYRNVAMDNGIKKMSPSGGNGLRVKGSYHEVYHNTCINRRSELNIATEKGGNSETITRNNATTLLTDYPIPGVNSGHLGKAPDLGAYEFGGKAYWIPSRQEARASMPIPKTKGKRALTNPDLMYLIGLNGVKAKVYFGTTPEALTLLATKKHPENIVTLSRENALQANQTYYWRVDTILKNETVIAGEICSFTALPQEGSAPAPAKRK